MNFWLPWQYFGPQYHVIIFSDYWLAKNLETFHFGRIELEWMEGVNFYSKQKINVNLT